MSGDERTVWIDVSFRWWARPCLFRWLWRLMGRVPAWAVRIRQIPPPKPE
jgi:hypothetical protein